MKRRIFNQKGSSMLLVICLFLVLAVLGINLLNAANANVSNTKAEFRKEQTMLYVGSVYDIVNKQIEDGFFMADDFSLPDTVKVTGFRDRENKDIGVVVNFKADTVPVESDIVITCDNAQGEQQSYTVKSTYSRIAGVKKLVRESCKGLMDYVEEP